MRVWHILFFRQITSSPKRQWTCWRDSAGDPSRSVWRRQFLFSRQIGSQPCRGRVSTSTRPASVSPGLSEVKILPESRSAGWLLLVLMGCGLIFTCVSHSNSGGKNERESIQSTPILSILQCYDLWPVSLSFLRNINELLTPHGEALFQWLCLNLLNSVFQRHLEQKRSLRARCQLVSMMRAELGPDGVSQQIPDTNRKHVGSVPMCRRRRELAASSRPFVALRPCSKVPAVLAVRVWFKKDIKCHKQFANLSEILSITTTTTPTSEPSPSS